MHRLQPLSVRSNHHALLAGVPDPHGDTQEDHTYLLKPQPLEQPMPPTCMKGALSDACAQGALHTVMRLVEKQYADINEVDKKHGMFPLARAAFSGHTAVLAYLLHHGANALQKDHRGQTFVHILMRKGYSDALKTSLKYSDAIAALSTADRQGDTPLDVCSSPELATYATELRDLQEAFVARFRPRGVGFSRGRRRREWGGAGAAVAPWALT